MITAHGGNIMQTKTIRPVSDLQNNLEEISNTVHKTDKPVYLTKNGYADMVIMSASTFENIQYECDIRSQQAEEEDIDVRLKYDMEFQREIAEKLIEAEKEMENPNARTYTWEEVDQYLRDIVRKCTK